MLTGGLPVLKISLKARSREEADVEPFCGGRAYGRVRGSAITGESIHSSQSTRPKPTKQRGNRWGTGRRGRVLVLPPTT